MSAGAVTDGKTAVTTAVTGGKTDGTAASELTGPHPRSRHGLRQPRAGSSDGAGPRPGSGPSR